MTINPYPSKKEIIALLKTIPFIEVLQGGVPDGNAIPLTSTGKIKPHLVVNWGGLIKPPKRVNGIQGASFDSFIQSFSTHAIAGDDDAAQQLHNLGWQKLAGFEPVGCGEVGPQFFAGIGEISSLSQPTRYSAVQAYKYLINP